MVKSLLRKIRKSRFHEYMVYAMYILYGRILLFQVTFIMVK